MILTLHKTLKVISIRLIGVLPGSGDYIVKSRVRKSTPRSLKGNLAKLRLPTFMSSETPYQIYHLFEKAYIKREMFYK